jgi:hypothetical protein
MAASAFRPSEPAVPVSANSSHSGLRPERSFQVASLALECGHSPVAQFLSRALPTGRACPINRIRGDHPVVICVASNARTLSGPPVAFAELRDLVSLTPFKSSSGHCRFMEILYVCAARDRPAL